MIFVDTKFANMLGSRLRNFKHKSAELWNFSCNICGDSKVKTTKARAYIYRTKGSLFVKCHNCQYSSSLGKFIERVDATLYQEYVMENYRANGVERKPPEQPEAVLEAFKKKEEVRDSILDSLRCIDSLPLDHPAVKYVTDRKIPLQKWPLLYFTTKFKRYVNEIAPGKLSNEDHEHPRLIIPFFNLHGKVVAFQGRAFKDEQPKYMTIKLDDTEERIYGLERVNYANRIYIVEGPLDSLFIPNCIAVSGSSFISPTIEALRTNATVIYDNEPRSKEITKLMKKTIEKGFAVCLWPETVEEKDINEMIEAGRTKEEILGIINTNTFSGPEALLRFATWKKCQETK